MIAVLEPTDAATMRVANKRFPVSSLGILPVALALDPEADVEDDCPEPGSFIHLVETVTFRGRTYLFAADMGGELLVYDLTEIPSRTSGPLDPDPSISNPVNPAPFAPVARHEITPDLTDDLRSSLYGLALDVVQWTEGEAEREELYVYLGVSRVGVAVLRLDPGVQPLPPILTYLDLLQTPGETEGLWIREDPVSGERRLRRRRGRGLRVRRHHPLRSDRVRRRLHLPALVPRPHRRPQRLQPLRSPARHLRGLSGFGDRAPARTGPEPLRCGPTATRGRPPVGVAPDCGLAGAELPRLPPGGPPSPLRARPEPAAPGAVPRDGACS